LPGEADFGDLPDAGGKYRPQSEKIRKIWADRLLFILIEEKNDFSYITRAKAGDKNAYGSLVEKYQKRVYRLVLALLGRKDMAEDITQNAFIKGYLALNDFEPGRPFYPWIAAIARNLAINQIKKVERERPISELDDMIIENVAAASNPLDQFIENENEKRFMAAVMSLPIQYRSVFILRMFEKMSYEDIARYLKISIGTVDSRLSRARQKLVELLKDSL
jgi:RNA polymerase sigma-70 factor (ECF subfamily)